MSLREFRENPGIQRYPKNAQEWRHWINEVAKWIGSSVELAQAQTDIVSAARTSVYAVSTPSGYVWNSDKDTGAFVADGQDLVTVFYDQTDTEVARRTLNGFMDVAGSITVTNVSSSQSAGYSTAFALVANISSSVKADITLTLPDSSTFIASVSWNAVDISAAGGTPATGGGK